MSTSPIEMPGRTVPVLSLAKALLPEAVNARATTVPAVFRAAARLIVVNGHWQGDYCPDAFDRHVKSPHAERPLSIVAALNCAATGDPHRSSPLSFAAVQVLAARLLVDGEGPAYGAIRFLEAHISAWGDAEGRLAESAVAVLEAAADACEVAA